MSRVTNILLSFSICEQQSGSDDYKSYVPTEAINVWLLKNNFGLLTCLDCHAGGKKAMKTPVFGGAFNYFTLDAFMERLSIIAWEYPGDVQVFVQGQDEEVFTIRTI